MNATILGKFDNNTLILQNNETKPNRNIICFGGPGSYKTQAVVITNVLAETENSIVATDQKGEVYNHTVSTKISQGYIPYVINIDDMRLSSRYNPLDYIERDIHASTIADIIVAAANKDSKKDVWYNSQRSLLKALILYVVHEFNSEKQNFTGLLNFLQAFNPQKNEDGLSELDLQFAKLDFNHPARRAYDLGFKLSEGEMQSSIIVSLLTTISDFVDEEVSEFMSESDFDLKDIGRKKIILYIVIPAMDRTFENVTNLFLAQLFEQLYDLGNKNQARLPRNVSFILDEFPNLGKFPNYEEFLATCRGYGIGVITICQSLTQLRDKYGPDRAESILGNNAIKICLNAANKTTAQYFCDLLGKATVRYETGGESISHSDKESRSTSDNYNYMSRDLMTIDEILRMDPNDCLLVFSNLGVIKAKKAFQFHVFPDKPPICDIKEFIRTPSANVIRENHRKKPNAVNSSDSISSQSDKEKLDELSRKETDIIFADSDDFFE